MGKHSRRDRELSPDDHARERRSRSKVKAKDKSKRNAIDLDLFRQVVIGCLKNWGKINDKSKGEKT